MPTLKELPYSIVVARFQRLPEKVQDFLLSDKKREDLINLVTYQGLPEEKWVRLNDIIWGLFLKKMEITMLEQGISEHLSIDGQKAKQVGESLRKTILAPFLDFFAPAMPKPKNNPLVPQGNVVNLREGG